VSSLGLGPDPAIVVGGGTTSSRHSRPESPYSSRSSSRMQVGTASHCSSYLRKRLGQDRRRALDSARQRRVRHGPTRAPGQCHRRDISGRHHGFGCSRQSLRTALRKPTRPRSAHDQRADPARRRTLRRAWRSAPGTAATGSWVAGAPSHSLGEAVFTASPRSERCSPGFRISSRRASRWSAA